MECKFTVIFSNDRRGRLFLFSFQKGAVIRGKAIIQGRRLFQMMLTKSHALILFSFIIPFYYIDTSVLVENIPLVKFIKTTSGTQVVYFP